jgi:hypothetical protein
MENNVSTYHAEKVQHAEVLVQLQEHAQALQHVRPTELYISTMTLEFDLSCRLNLQVVEAALRQRFDFSAIPHTGTRWRGKGFSKPRRFKGIIVRGRPFGDACLSLQVTTSDTGFVGQSCHAKLFNSGHVKLMGCRSYDMADVAADKILDVIRATATSTDTISVVQTKTNLINGVFSMPPFSKDRPIAKVDLNNYAREDGFHVHTGASDGKPYVKLVLDNGCKALVYVSGKVWVTGCKSVAELGAAVKKVLNFIDSRAVELD